MECVECARRTITIKSVATSTAPNHLALGMKRFLFDRHTCSLRKERRAVTLRESLVLEVTSHVVSYELYAIVVHAGVTMDSGHYYSYALSSAMTQGADEGIGEHESWVKLDDDTVTSGLGFSEVVEALSGTEAGLDTAYLLFFCQRSHNRDMVDCESKDERDDNSGYAIDKAVEAVRLNEIRRLSLATRQCQAHLWRAHLLSTQQT